MSAKTPKKNTAEVEKRKVGRPNAGTVRWVGRIKPETAQKLTAIMESYGCTCGRAIDIIASQ